MRTIFDLCVPRDDVLKGTVQESDFAADLAQVNWILVRAGVRPIAIEAPRQEYIACLNH